ncbi:MAG: allantoate deiminase [Paraglaciecola sp.]|jgi:allantoate deiminase
MDIFNRYAVQAYDRCELLANISQDPACVDRRYLTPQHQQVNQQVALWMQQAGMKVWQDEAGNQWGRYTSNTPNAQTVVIGSHLDTVPNSGKYDGILGVMTPLSLIQYFHDNQVALPYHLELVGFGDEEGTRFGATLLGSCAVAGTWQERWATLEDENGISLAQAMGDFGLDINHIKNAGRGDHSISSFIEFHIEQGPVLEDQDLAVGIVSGIAGANRFSINITGQAGHAGTVPMSMRKDALAASSDMILAIERIARSQDIVATVGHLQCKSGAVNVICGETAFSLDIRSTDDEHKDKVVGLIIDEITLIAKGRKVDIDIKATHQAHGVKCDQQLQVKLANALKASGIEPYTLSSGAGHDTMAMAKICPVAMLFMRCEKGISHNPAEAVSISDIAVATQVLAEFLVNY